MKKAKAVKKSIGKSASKAGKAARKAFKAGSKSVKKSLREGAAVVRKEIKTVTPIVQKAVQAGVEKVVHVTGEAAKLAKLKVEMVGLKNEKDHLYREMGGELWILHQQQRLDAVQESLAESFRKMAELEGRIAAKDAEIQAVSLT
jgi:hypothetical protein